MIAFYNEIDPYCCAWLSNLMDAGLITPGVISNESIEDLTPNELIGYDRVHFFAGIGGWDYALNLAGWGERPVWTGSCPCQPFSAAGKGAGFADERHLWPQFHYLIEQCRPAVVFGEQVASKDGLDWLNLVQTDLEGTGYATAAADLCAAGVGAPHIRQRLYWVADSTGARSLPSAYTGIYRREKSAGPRHAELERFGATCGVADNRLPEPPRRNDFAQGLQHRGGDAWRESSSRGHACGVGNTESERRGETRKLSARPAQRPSDASAEFSGLADTEDSGQPGQLLRTGTGLQADGIAQDGLPSRLDDSGRGAIELERPGPTNGAWGNVDWLRCRDGKWRPVSPKPQPLVDGSSESLGRVRPGTIEEIEREINAWAMENKVDGDSALRNLLKSLGTQAQSCWTFGRIPGLHEAPFLLAFLRQLTEQGWRIKKRLPISCEEINRAVLRGVRCIRGTAGAPRKRELERQSPGEYSDALPFLSSLLARHAREAWSDAYAAYAETAFPLAHGVPARVGKLRAYGNAIVPQIAQIFIESYLYEI